eukprot:4200910-Alexandrium_andersonii.AAC.1
MVRARRLELRTLSMWSQRWQILSSSAARGWRSACWPPCHVTIPASFSVGSEFLGIEAIEMSIRRSLRPSPT